MSKTPSLEQATNARLSEIRDILRSGAGELAGRGRREAGESDDERGGVSGRFRGYSHAYPELQNLKLPRTTLLRALENRSGKVFERLQAAARRVMEYHGFMEAQRRSAGKPTVAAHLGRKTCKHCQELHTSGQHRFHGKGSYHKTHLFSFGGEVGKKNPVVLFGSFTSKLAANRRAAKHPGSLVVKSTVTGKYVVGKWVRPKRVSNPKQSKRLVRIYGRVLRIEAQKLGPHRNCDAECKRCNHKYVHDFKAGAVMYGQPDGSILIKKG